MLLQERLSMPRAHAGSHRCMRLYRCGVTGKSEAGVMDVMGHQCGHACLAGAPMHTLQLGDVIGRDTVL
jgi:hypothetical protein